MDKLEVALRILKAYPKRYIDRRVRLAVKTLCQDAEALMLEASTGSTSSTATLSAEVMNELRRKIFMADGVYLTGEKVLQVEGDVNAKLVADRLISVNISAFYYSPRRNCKYYFVFTTESVAWRQALKNLKFRRASNLISGDIVDGYWLYERNTNCDGLLDKAGTMILNCPVGAELRLSEHVESGFVRVV